MWKGPFSDRTFGTIRTLTTIGTVGMGNCSARPPPKPVPVPGFLIIRSPFPIIRYGKGDSENPGTGTHTGTGTGFWKRARVSG